MPRTSMDIPMNLPTHPMDTVVRIAPQEIGTRELLRRLRRPTGEDEGMPESQLWRDYLELNRRGQPDATELFLRSLKNLHRRRALGNGELSTTDPAPKEHQLVDNPYVGELWKAYKRCISQRRIGPAGQLLRDLAEQISA